MRACPNLPILLVALLLPLMASAQDTSELDGGEIFVTTGDVPGSDIPSVTVTGVINAPPERVWAIVEDCDNYAGRMPRTDESVEISREGNIVICEVTIGLPFPLKDLSSRTRAIHTVGPPTWHREWTLVEGDYRTNDGSWTLTAFEGDDSRTLAVYSIHADPKNRIPDSIRRRAQESSMPGVIETLRELAASD